MKLEYCIRTRRAGDLFWCQLVGVDPDPWTTTPIHLVEGSKTYRSVEDALASAAGHGWTIYRIGSNWEILH